MDRYIVFTDFDLDGAGCYLTYKWFFPDQDTEVIPLKVSNLREKLLSWLNNNSFESYKRIYFFDLDTTDIADLIDRPNVVIVDHHETHKQEYKQAQTNIVVTTSCSKLLYNQFKQSKIKLSVPQIKLLSLIDDYDSYTLKFPDSYNLNILFWYFNSNRLQFFAERFKEGFDSFTSQEKNLLRAYRRKFKKYYNDLRLYAADIELKGSSYTFISGFVDKYVNDVAHNILNDNKQCHIVMLINSGNKRVYFRKQNEVDVDLGKLAAHLCSGGGHKNAAGSVLNDTIKILSKDFQPL